MKLNKLTALLLSVCCLFSAVTFAAAADVEAQPGSTVEYTVSLDESVSIAGFKIHVDYDTDVFSLATDADDEFLITQGSFSTKGTLLVNTSATGCSVLWYHTKDVTASGSLFTITLNVAEDAPAGTYPVALSYSPADTVNVSAEKVSLSLSGPSIVIPAEEEPVVPADSAVITVSDAKVLIGETITVPVTVSGNPGFSGFVLELGELAEGITLKSIKKGSLLKESESGSFLANISTGIVNWYDSADITGNGELLVLEFEIAETCPAAEYPISVSLKNNAALNFVNSDAAAVSVSFETGTLTVDDYTLGDIDDDGEITGGDAVLMARYIVGYDTLSEKALKAADIDKDGMITSADCVKVARYLVGLITEL